ncbi:UNVERIFIED_CONTAM: hypothetical protein Slati_0845500 [Sesamum latifolium]|uniref:Reverse transcriptase Ty1/copia-type domain-containing protein n=1 Tax=Sesamum latifolium TaxID=2727402 RepID=A0AAW2XNA5_9LAMI
MGRCRETISSSCKLQEHIVPVFHSENIFDRSHTHRDCDRQDFLVVPASLTWHIEYEEIHIKPPECYSVPVGHACRLRRSLYELKQASRQWNQDFTSKLESYDFAQSNSSPSKILGAAKSLLGLEIARSSTRLAITQTKYIRDIVADAGVTNAKPVTTPLPIGIRFRSSESNTKS